MFINAPNGVKQRSAHSYQLYNYILMRNTCQVVFAKFSEIFTKILLKVYFAGNITVLALALLY